MGAETWSTAGWVREPGLLGGKWLVFWSQKEGLLGAEGTPAQEAEIWQVWAVLRHPPQEEWAALGCRGPAPADPGSSKERRHRRGSGNNCLIKR